MLIKALVALALTIGPLTGLSSSASPARAAAEPAPGRRTTFGVAIAPVPERIRRLPYLLENEGVVLTEVRPGGAAEAAGLRVGDIVLAVDGKRVDETTLFATLRECPRNQSFRVEVLRDSKWMDTWVTIAG